MRDRCGAAHASSRSRRKRRHSDNGLRAGEVIDEEVEPLIDDAELELLRIRAAMPRFGQHDRRSRASCGSRRGHARAVDFEKKGYRVRDRSRVSTTVVALTGTNRTLIYGQVVPEYDAYLRRKVVGRVTSAARDGDGVVALATRQVPGEAVLSLGTRW